MRGRLVDPEAEHDRFLRDNLGVRSQREIEREIDDLKTFGTPRERTVPSITGSLSDGTALQSLIRALEQLGMVQDKTTR